MLRCKPFQVYSAIAYTQLFIGGGAYKVVKYYALSLGKHLPMKKRRKVPTVIYKAVMAAL